MSAKELFILSFLLIINSIICYNYNDEDLTSIIDDYESNKLQLKLISCLNLVHSFLSQRDGDQKLKKIIKNSKFSHDKLFIKYVTSSMKKCSDKISSQQITYLLTPENTDNYNTLNTSITNLIKINENFDTIELTKDEQFIYDKISKQIFEQNLKSSKKKKEKGVFQKYKAIIITALIIIGSILFYFRYVKREIKEEKKDNNFKETNKKQFRKRKN